MRSLLGTLAIVALLAASGRARADDEADRCATEAEAGQTSRGAGKLREARRHMIACSRESCPRVIRSDCARWLAEVEAELPTIVIRARDAAGSDLADAAVLVDGEKVAERVDGRPIPVDAGERLVRVERRGGGAASQRIVVRSGERSRLVTVQLEGGEPTARRSTTGPIVLGATGLAFVAAGAVLWGIGTAEHDDLASSCAPSGTCATRDVDAARTKLVVGDVAAGLGVLAVAGAVTWYLVTSSAKKAPTAALLTF